MTDAKTLIEFIKANAGTAPTVETQAQADEFTAADQFGHRWQVGEAYYTMPAHPNSLLSKPRCAGEWRYVTQAVAVGDYLIDDKPMGPL